jgi:hypothetical protein
MVYQVQVPAATREQVERCSDLLREIEPSSEPVADERKELQALAKKIKKWQNPENIDLVALQRAKPEGKGDNDKKTVKKRKLKEGNPRKKATIYSDQKLKDHRMRTSWDGLIPHLSHPRCVGILDY